MIFMAWRWMELSRSLGHLGVVKMTGEEARLAGPALGEAEFADLYTRTYGRVLALAVATVRSRSIAEDVVHDAYAQLWTQRQAVTHPAAWLRRAVVSNCLASLRTQRRREAILRRSPPGSLTASTSTPDERAFLDLLTGLNERQRIALTLRYLEDLSDVEIAAVLECRPGTVKSMLHRARQTLRSRMEGEP